MFDDIINRERQVIIYEFGCIIADFCEYITDEECVRLVK